MQKINREALKAAMIKINTGYRGVEDYPDLFEQAAAILLEITDPEFVPIEGMMGAAETNKTELLSFKSIFRAMIRELVE